MSHTDTRPDLSRCSYRTAKGRQCKLAPHGDDVKHRMVLRDQIAKPPTLAELRAKGLNFALTMEAVPKGTSISREYHREAGPRDADQIKVDRDARQSYAAWDKAGKPKNQDKMPWQRYIIPPAAFDTVVVLLRRTITSGGPVAGKVLRYRRKIHESGNTMIYFVVTDRLVSDNTQASITGQRG